MNRSHIQDSYVELKLKLIKLAVEASKNVTTFALLEEMAELHGQFCYSENELHSYNNDTLILKCYLLNKKLTEYLTDLADYGITDRKQIQLEQTIEDFRIISGQHTAMMQEINQENAVKADATISN
jgi:hypothetical protein